MKDLLEQLMQLNEAPVQPGERKGISFKLKRLEKISDKLRQYQNSMSHMKMAQLPGELQKEMQQLQDKLNSEIDKVDQAYQIEYEKSKVNDRPVKMDNMFKALAKNCKEIIKVYKELNRNNFEREKFLFRGIKSSDDALYGKPFESRKPKDSNRDLHELVNGTINSLGFTANRENSMFVTGDRSQASGYGNSLYILFPVDGFTFTWSRTVKDLVLDSSKRVEMMDKAVVNQIKDIVKKAKAENPEDFPIYDPDDLFYSGYNYENDKSKVLDAVESGKLPNEVKGLVDDLLTDKSIQQHFQFTDQDLFGAILSNKEIYVRGNYYAVKTEHSKELFRFLENMNTDDVELPENFGEVPDILDKGDIVKILSGNFAGKLGTIIYDYSTTYEVFITQSVGDISISKDDVELYHLPDGSIPIYEKNDKIIVTDPKSRLYGSVATLEFVYTSGKVELIDTKGTFYSLFKNQIEHYTPEREQEIQKEIESKPPTISEPDEVVVSDPNSEYYGWRGRVTFVYGSGKIEVRLEKKDDFVTFQPEQLVLLKNAPPELLNKTPGEDQLDDSVKGIKVGDTVQVSNDESTYYGETGEVIEVNVSPTGKHSIRFKNASYPAGIKTFVEWVEKVDQPQQTQQTFKKGDKFKVKQKSYSIDGSIATVIKGPDSDGDYHAVTDDGTTIYTAPFQMEKIENFQSPFNIGDTVKIIDKSSGFSGMVGKIGTEPDSDGDYTVMFDEDDGEEWTYAKSDEMEKVEQPQQPQASPTFAEGDKVKITGPSAYNNNTFIGRIGTITSLVDSNHVGVRIDGDDEDTILTYNVTNLSKSEKDEIDNLTWEPEPEVNAPSEQFAPIIEVNDRVEVASQFPSLIGMQGKVVQVSPNYDFVSVQLDNNTSPSSFPTTALKKIDEPQQTEEFHLGDMVEVTNSELSSFGQKGKITDMDVAMLVIQDSSSGDVFFAKKANVKKIG